MKKSDFQFINPFLEELHFKENETFEESESNLEIENSFGVQIKRDKAGKKAKVELTLEINIDKKQSPFELRIRLSSYFIWENMDKQQVESMLKCNAPALLLSYMRPIVSSITGFSQFPAYNLPFINFNENQAHIKKEKY